MYNFPSSLSPTNISLLSLNFMACICESLKEQLVGAGFLLSFCGSWSLTQVIKLYGKHFYH